jgi:hypothetical protein
MTIEEGTARFLTTVFAGITALTLVGGAVYSLLEYRSNSLQARKNFTLQLEAAKRQAQQPYLSKQLELCNSVSSAAATLATSKDRTSRRQASDTFYTLYLGGLRIVHNPQDQAINDFKNCLEDKCGPGQSLETLAPKIADSCRSEIETGWDIVLRKNRDSDK